MSIRLQRAATVLLNGKVQELLLIENPLIDDVIVAEAKVKAYQVASSTTDPSRRVNRDIRDFLIRLGVTK